MVKKLTCLLVVIVFIISLGMNVFAATVGEALVAPETGWQRIDDNNPLIKYTPNILLGSNYSCFETTVHYNWDPLVNTPADFYGEINFRFNGTKLRIIGYSPKIAGSVKVLIDGVDKGQCTLVTITGKYLAYDVQNLTLGVHRVTLQVSGTGFGFDAIDIDSTGGLLDTNTPDAPASLSATSSDSKVELSWTATTGSAITYNVKRSTTAGGPYITVTTTSAVSFTDDSVTNGTTYYYVVSAVNSSGESENSNEVSATPTAPNEPPVTDGSNAILEITLTNGFEKEYDLTSAELQDFLSWYDDRSSGAGKAYYTFNIKNNIKPFLSRKEYISFDKIISFEVKEYSE